MARVENEMETVTARIRYHKRSMALVVKWMLAHGNVPRSVSSTLAATISILAESIENTTDMRRPTLAESNLLLDQMFGFRLVRPVTNRVVSVGEVEPETNTSMVLEALQSAKDVLEKESHQHTAILLPQLDREGGDIDGDQDDSG